ncbi:unnamed protein product, partial [Rotaria sp. Silwood1]
MAAMQAPDDSLIAFACAASETVEDSMPNGRNGVFTYHLLKHIMEPGEDIRLVMTNVIGTVTNLTNKQQRPFFTSGLRQQDIPLVPFMMQETNPKHN